MKQLINFPTKGYEDTGEGGLLVAFVILSEDGKARQCIAGDFYYGPQDVVLGPEKYQRLNHDGYYKSDVLMVVGSTKKSLFSNEIGFYFTATKEDLNKEGKSLFESLTRIYGVEPDIVTFLDT